MTKGWLDSVAAKSLGYRETLEATYDITTTLVERGIPGDLVECGVFAGAHCAVMAEALIDAMDRSERRIHLFDSFEGLPAADERDQEIWAHHGAKTGEAACSLEAVKQNMKDWDIPESMLVYHPGWFEDTVRWDKLPQFENGIALLRLDADLYSSTKICIENLYPLVNRGGYVIVDDWNLSGCRQAINETVVPAPICWRLPTK